MPGGAIQVDWEGRAIDPDAYVDLGKQGKTEGLLLIPITLSPNLQGQDRGAHGRVNVAGQAGRPADRRRPPTDRSRG